MMEASADVSEFDGMMALIADLDQATFGQDEKLALVRRWIDPNHIPTN